MEKEPCWLCGFKGTRLDLHIGLVGDLLRDAPGSKHWSEWSLQQLVGHRLHLESMRREL